MSKGTYSLSSFIYHNDVKIAIKFRKKTWTTETKSGEDLPENQKSETCSIFFSSK